MPHSAVPQSSTSLPTSSEEILRLCPALVIAVLPAVLGFPGTEAPPRPSGIAVTAEAVLFSVANDAGFKSKTCTVSGF